MKEKRNTNRDTIFRPRLITDIVIIACSILSIPKEFPVVLENILLGICLVLIICIIFDIRPIKFTKKKREEKVLSTKQHRLISHTMDFVTKYFYILFFIYIILQKIDNLFWTILTCLFWILFALYFILRIVCYKLKINQEKLRPN